MTSQTRAVLKGKFENGDKPQGSDYGDWIDSMVAVADTTAQQVQSDLIAPKFIATTEVSATQVNTAEVSASAGNFTQVRASGADFASVSAVNVRANNVSASSMNVGTIDNPVQIGPAGARGRPVLTQTKIVSAAATTKSTAAVLPDGASIIDIKYFQQNPVGASATAQINVLVGTSAQDARFASFLNVSAQGYYTVPTSTRTSSWSNVSAASGVVFVHVSAISGAVASGARGELNILYVHRQ